MPLLDPPLMLALISYRTPAASFISQDSFIPANLPWWSALWLLVLVVHFYNISCVKGTGQVLVPSSLAMIPTYIDVDRNNFTSGAAAAEVEAA